MDTLPITFVWTKDEPSIQDADDIAAKDPMENYGGDHEHLWIIISALMIASAAVILIFITVLVIFKARNIHRAQERIKRQEEGIDTVPPAYLTEPLYRASILTKIKHFFLPPLQQTDTATKMAQKPSFYRWDAHERKSTDDIMCTKGYDEDLKADVENSVMALSSTVQSAPKLALQSTKDKPTSRASKLLPPGLVIYSTSPGALPSIVLQEPPKAKLKPDLNSELAGLAEDKTEMGFGRQAHPLTPPLFDSKTTKQTRPARLQKLNSRQRSKSLTRNPTNASSFSQISSTIPQFTSTDTLHVVAPQDTQESDIILIRERRAVDAAFQSPTPSSGVASRWSRIGGTFDFTVPAKMALSGAAASPVVAVGRPIITTRETD